MKIIDTFEIIKHSLYAVVFDNEPKKNEFGRLMDFWNDAISLNEFFEEHEDDLNDPFWNGITIEDAIFKTQREAKALEQLLLEYANGKTLNLSMLFKPLSDKDIGDDLERDKVRVAEKNSWIRIYAIRIEVNLFVICGGAIKLRKTINDRPYLIQELTKLDITKRYLQDKDDDELELFELY